MPSSPEKGECNAQTVSKRKIRGNISGENGFKDNIICDNVTLCDNEHDPNNHRGNYRIAWRNGLVASHTSNILPHNVN